jgi:hypothetical protein
MLYNNGTSGAAGASFDLTTGQFSLLSNATSASIETLSDGWYRISVTFTNVAGNTGPSIYGLPSLTGSSIYQGDGTSGFYLFGFQTNTNSLKDYVATTGTAKTADVHVVNWYDQGMGEDFTQSTANYQPRLVRGSELVTDSGGKASVYFDGSDNLINATLAGQNRLDSYIVIEPDLAADDSQVLLSGNSSDYIGLIFDDGNTSQEINKGSGTPSEFINGTQLATNATRNDVHDKLGSTSIFSLTDATTSSFTTFQMGWNNSAGSSLNYQGNLSEMVFFPNMDSSPKRFPIEQNMMNHFEIYDHESDFSADTNGYSVTDGTAMTFDTFTGNNDGIGGETDVLRVTVDSSTGGRFHLKRGSIETDTVTNYEVTFDYLTGGSGFNNKFWLLGTAFSTTHGTKSEENAKIIADSTWRSVTLNGNLTSNGELYIKATTNTSLIVGDNLGILGSSVAGQTIYFKNIKVRSKDSDGYVTTLYDQTGNNCHALQATAANQPQIVSGGDLIKSGNHPAWEYPVSNPQRNLRVQGVEGVSTLDAFFVAETSDAALGYPVDPSVGYRYGLVAEDSSTNTTLSSSYGSPVLEINGVQQSPSTRDDVHTAYQGRKLVYHRSASTSLWENVDMGHFAGITNYSLNIENTKFSEWIWYDSDQHSNQSGIESNINTHYNIYS